MDEKFYSLKAYNKKHHLLFWLANVTIYVFFIALTGGGFFEPLVNKLCYLPSQLILTYAFFYLLFPLLDRRKYLFASLSFVAFSYLSTAIARILKIYVYETALAHDDVKEPIFEILTQPGPLLSQYMLWSFLTPIITIMIVLLINHYRRQEKVEQLKKEKGIAELNFLKAQVHPHFLFNTLNNLYALALIKSPETSGIAGKLHNMLDYMLHKCNQKLVAIEEEVKLISNYIDIEKIRYANGLIVNFTSQIGLSNYKIAPLILITLVENAFKHGVSGSTLESYINISLRVNSSEVIFNVTNSKNDLRKSDQGNYKKGIGLKNLEKQLDLIYNESHDFQIEETKDKFSTSLVIEIGDGK